MNNICCRRYLISAPKTVRPDMLYNVVTMLMHDELEEATVYAGIARDEEVMAEASIPVAINALSTIPIKVSFKIKQHEMNFFIL